MGSAVVRAASVGARTQPAGKVQEAPTGADVRAFSDIATPDGQDVTSLGCILDVIPMERLVWTSMSFPGYPPAVFDDIPITAVITMESVGAGTRYIFTGLRRDEADYGKDRTSGWQQGTEIAADQFVAHVMSMR